MLVFDRYWRSATSKGRTKSTLYKQWRDKTKSNNSPIEMRRGATQNDRQSSNQDSAYNTNSIDSTAFWLVRSEVLYWSRPVNWNDSSLGEKRLSCPQPPDGDQACCWPVWWLELCTEPKVGWQPRDLLRHPAKITILGGGDFPVCITWSILPYTWDKKKNNRNIFCLRRDMSISPLL